MKYIVSYSGGIGSAMTLQLALTMYGKDNVIGLFADTLIEDAELYKFNANIEKIFDFKLTVISEGRTPWQLFRDEGFIGNSRVDLCSRILKRELITKWIRDRFAFNEYECFIGIDCSEEHRMPPIVKRYYPHIYRSLLIENNIILTQSAKKAWCESINVDLPRLYKYGFSHNNCGGFCVKAGLGHYANLFRVLPDVYKHHEQTEQDLMKENPKLRPFLKKQVRGQTIYLTLRQYRETYLEPKIDIGDAIYEHGGCGCGV